ERYPGNSIVSEDLQITHHGIYKRSLRFTNAQFFNTGRYFCSYTNRDTPSASTTTASPGGGTGVHSGGVPDRLGGASVDVFVSDPDHMFIREGSSMYPGTNFHLVVIYYGQEAVIPCAVSDPDFNVTLIRTIGQQDFTDEEGVTFDPVYGFVVASPYYVFSGSFKCFAKGTTEDGLAEEELTAYLMFRGKEMQFFNHDYGRLFHCRHYIVIIQHSALCVAGHGRK
ncbi:hypothetical protein BaRGS_00030069, partial [Batillaria attramentaria]